VTSDSLWELTWQHVYSISPSLQPNMFSEQTSILKGDTRHEEKQPLERQ
jgi:hypothetical protein